MRIPKGEKLRNTLLMEAEILIRILSIFNFSEILIGEIKSVLYKMIKRVFYHLKRFISKYIRFTSEKIEHRIQQCGSPIDSNRGL